ncbi:MAG: hypothetical protein RL708_1717 [Bacteroidota bacterium]|jgi:hypothetical protein
MLMIALQSCCFYSLKSGQLSADIKTASVHYIANQAATINPALSQQFTEALRNKLINESGLKLVDKGGDLDFSGYIADYKIIAVGRTGNQAAGSQLSITVKIDYVNNKKANEKWSQQFTKSINFDATQSFSSIENSLVAELNRQIVDDIFNKSVVNW